MFLCLWLFETWFPAWLSFRKTVGPPDYPAVHYKRRAFIKKAVMLSPPIPLIGYHCRWKCGHAENDDAGSQGQRQVENRDTDCQGKNNAFYGIADVKSSV